MYSFKHNKATDSTRVDDQSGTYAMKKSFFHEAYGGGDALEFVQFVLGLRLDTQIQRTLGDFRRHQGLV